VNNETDIIGIALRTIQIELDTIVALKESINNDFEECVKVIFNSKGRLIITGVGKSALIAKKIVATLNSTGTPSIFMHASDAIHGDLGMIRKEDIVLCISKSGDTPEIKVLIPLIKNLGNKLLGMVSSLDSHLGKQADFVLHTPVVSEADPNNLAPTASTTAQLVIGDALATSLLALRGFTPNDFAQIHPGGVLGKQLYLRVRDLYVNNEKPQVPYDADINTIILEMTSKRLGVTVVLDEDKQIIGIITDGDLRRMLEHKKDLTNVTATDLMTKDPKHIVPEALAVKALSEMRAHSITQLLVATENEYLGILHLHDLLREGLI